MNRSALVLALNLALADPAIAQSAQDIVNRHIKAIGGKRALEAIARTTLAGVISSADGRAGIFEQETARPNRLYVSLAWGDVRWTMGFNGRAAWRQDETGPRTLMGPSAARVRADAFYANDRLLLSAAHGAVVGGAQGEVRGRRVLVVETLMPGGRSRRLSFDAEHHWLVKDEQQTESGPDVRFFDDYRRVGEVMEPHAVEWHRPGETLRITIERVVHNGPADERLFDIPVPASDPLPDAAAILDGVRRNRPAVAERLHGWASMQTRTSREIDARGRVAKQEVQVFEVFYVGGASVLKLISQDGEALSERDRRREDERVRKILLDYERRRARDDDGRDVEAVTAWIASYLRMSDFSEARREHVRGRAALVLEFQPKPNARPSGDGDAEQRTTAGVLWIDERLHQVIAADVYLGEGDAGSLSGRSMWSDGVLMDDEVWLPSYLETNMVVSARGRRLRLQTTWQYDDYKRFEVDTALHIPLPADQP